MLAKTTSASGATWVLVADARRADVYRRATPSDPLEPIQHLEDDAARAREQELVSDKPGRAFDSGGQGRHAMEPPHTAKQQLRTAFAQRIVHALAEGRRAGAFEQLIIVAAPAMLGELRAQLDGPTAVRVTAEFDKDLAGQDVAAVQRLLDKAG